MTDVVKSTHASDAYVIPFTELRMTDVPSVGGKNASLGEMISQLQSKGVRVPGGFATTSLAFRDFLSYSANGGETLAKRIEDHLAKTDVHDVRLLAEAGSTIRKWIIETPLQPRLEKEILEAYEKLLATSPADMSVAVRSSATAEDLQDASFAGQQETFLNISGKENLLEAVKEVFASLYNDRAISYREQRGFKHEEVALSVGVQQMVRSDIGSSGVMFTIDTESGFQDVVFITSCYGLGETVVQGAVNPDEFYVHKPMLEQGKMAIVRRNIGSKLIQMVFSKDPSSKHPVDTIPVSVEMQRRYSLTDAEVMELARFAVIIEKHYERPMDIEWGKDGFDGKLYILQARPETVKSQQKHTDEVRVFRLKEEGTILVTGRAIGQKIGIGPVKIIKDPSEMHRVEAGDILVADMTDPNWEPVMKKAAAIVTNRGGRTCHAAIVAREIGVPAVVGCANATEILKDGMKVTVSCAEGDEGRIYEGILAVEESSVVYDNLPPLPIKMTMNIGNPSLAFENQAIPNDGVGLARLEFIINEIGIHPQAALAYPNVDDDLKRGIESIIYGHESPRTYYVDKLAEGVATIAAAFWPKPVIVRMSDFKTNEYRSLMGGSRYEPEEENPMLGFRGAARYLSKDFSEAFQMECEALKRVRNDMGLTNVEIMVPFIRTLTQAHKVVDLLAQNGLARGQNDLRLIMMCEVPSNAILADEFLELFDGFSIGSNDMTQLTLGLDRDSGIELLAEDFDERDPAVQAMIARAIQACNKQGKYVGICGQGPSDRPDFAHWLIKQGIGSLSLNPDSVLSTWETLVKGE
ncbi:phosphoenolpyruvate synthase [Oxalobacter vibrioformis]|uniref:Phosphoenolpyruvate synthase n=1 Tax=Oxalobacter vibrioformis TaxID=933080 RepID=A0A9E9LZQ8_9BURK|nr:phosphoenolpyruvate synthase [Oxalobacter vibrioformis]WAW10522.1 phosphoenolpyruvate synthase [Oxalobacter vibrioformis]